MPSRRYNKHASRSRLANVELAEVWREEAIREAAVILAVVIREAGRGGMGGGMGRGGMGNPAGGVSTQEWAQLAANPTYLEITQPDEQIVITDSKYTRTLYPDGKKHKATDEDGNKISTKTEWQGEELVAETKIGSGKLTETFQVSSDGKQLTVVSRYDNSSLSEPMTIQRVYDLGNAAH